MGQLKPSQKHRVVVEVHGRNLKDVTSYMKDLRKLLKKYKATIRESRKLQHRPVRRKKSK